MPRIPSIEQKFYYAAPPARVFAALTEPKILTSWFCEKAEVTLEKGGPYRLTWRGGYTMAGRVRAAKAPSRLTLAWVDQFEGGKVFETRVQFDLQRKGRGCLLTVTHRGFKKGKRWIALYGAIESGWAHYLTNLRSVLEHGTDLRSAYDNL